LIDNEQIAELIGIGDEVSAQERETAQKTGEDEYGLEDMVL